MSSSLNNAIVTYKYNSSKVDVNKARHTITAIKRADYNTIYVGEWMRPYSNRVYRLGFKVNKINNQGWLYAGLSPRDDLYHDNLNCLTPKTYDYFGGGAVNFNYFELKSALSSVRQCRTGDYVELIYDESKSTLTIYINNSLVYRFTNIIKTNYEWGLSVYYIPGDSITLTQLLPTNKSSDQSFTTV